MTLGEAAQRLAGVRSRQSLVTLAQGKRGPGGFPAPAYETAGTAFYSFAEITDYLRKLGDDIEAAPRDAAVADRILKAVDAIETAGVSGPVLRSLGWKDAA